jgi:hypothetical protein
LRGTVSRDRLERPSRGTVERVESRDRLEGRLEGRHQGCREKPSRGKETVERGRQESPLRGTVKKRRLQGPSREIIVGHYLGAVQRCSPNGLSKWTFQRGRSPDQFRGTAQTPSRGAAQRGRVKKPSRGGELRLDLGYFDVCHTLTSAVQPAVRVDVALEAHRQAGVRLAGRTGALAAAPQGLEIPQCGYFTCKTRRTFKERCDGMARLPANEIICENLGRGG